MKLYQSRVLHNLDQFRCNPGYNLNLMRDHEGMFIMWKVLEYFQPKSVLEIGFGCGQTIGLIVDALGDNCKRIVSVDLKHNRTNFENLFPEHCVEFIEIDSKTLQLCEQFDFIFIDGDHSYNGVSADIKTCLPLLHKNSILCMDDYYFDGIDSAIVEHLLTSDFVPFLYSYQQIYFHHKEHSAEDFLDNWLIVNSENFINHSLKNYHGVNVLYGHLHNIMFIKDIEIFKLGLKFFNQ